MPLQIKGVKLVYFVLLLKPSIDNLKLWAFFVLKKRLVDVWFNDMFTSKGFIEARSSRLENCLPYWLLLLAMFEIT